MASKVLAEKSQDEILFPTPIEYKLYNTILSIAPMNDGKLIKVGDALQRVVSVVQGATEYVAAISKDPNSSSVSIISVLPEVFKVALPEVTQIISASTDLSIEQVQKIPLAHKIGIFKAIVEAEDIPLILKNATSLMSLFNQSPSAAE